MAGHSRDDPFHPSRKPGAHLALAATAVVVPSLLCFWLTTYVAGWDKHVLDAFLPVGEDASRFALVAVVALLLFGSALAALSLNQERLEGSLRVLAEESIRASEARPLRVGLWIPVLLTLGVAFGTPAAYSGWINPWLWGMAASVALGLVLSAFSPTLGPASQRPVRFERESPAPSSPDAWAWWQSMLDSPLYHGQVHRTRSLPARGSGSAERMASVPAELEALKHIYETLIGPDAPLRGYVVKAFQLLMGSRAASGSQGPVCIVDLPHGAGLTTLIGALAIHERTAQFRRTLVVAPDDVRSGTLETRLREVVERDIRWSGTIKVSHVRSRRDLGGLGVQSYEDIPDLLVVDPSGLDVVLRLAATHPWNHLFATLGLVAIVGSYGFVGTRGAHIAMLLRRLEVLWHRAGARPAYLIECISATDQYQFVGELLGRQEDVGQDLVVTDEDTPRRPIEIVGWIPNLKVGQNNEVTRRSFLDDACAIAASGVRNGLNVMVIRSGNAIAEIDLTELRSRIAGDDKAASSACGSLEVVTSVTEAKRRVLDYDVVVYAGFPTSWVEFEHEVALLGTRRADGPKYVVLVAPHEPPSVAFIRQHLARTDAKAPRTTLEVENEAILKLHLRALVGSAALLSSELKVLADEKLIRPFLDEWLREGRIAYGSTMRAGAVVPAPGQEAYFDPMIDLEAIDEAVTRLVDVAAGDEVLARVDPGRAYLFGYPGALVVLHGKRYQVNTPLQDDVVRMGSMSIVDQVTHLISEIRVSSSEVENAHAQRFCGSAVTAGIGKRNVVISETVQGYRQRRISMPSERGLPMMYEEPYRQRRPDFVTTATLLGFPECESRDAVSEAVLHTIAHALRVVAPLYIRYRQEDLGMVVMPECSWFNGNPALVLYDNARLGIGIDEQLRSSMSPGLLTACLELLISCPCERGCPACVADPCCNRGSVLQELDKVGAIRLLGGLLDEKAAQKARSAIARLGEPISDVHVLGRLAQRVADEIVVPMLGLQIADVPSVLPDEKLPPDVAGRYDGDENLIRIRPMPERQTVAVLAHELAHAWSLQPGGFSPVLVDDRWPDSGALFLEGFAQWVEVKALDYFGFEAEVSEISGWPPDSYGIGFRLFNKLEEDPELGGVHGVRRFVQKPDAEWLRKHFGSADYKVELAQIRKLIEEGQAPPPDWTPPPVDEGQESADDAEAEETALKVEDTGPDQVADEAVASAITDDEQASSDEEGDDGRLDATEEHAAPPPQVAIPEEYRAQPTSASGSDESSAPEARDTKPVGRQEEEPPNIPVANDSQAQKHESAENQARGRRKRKTKKRRRAAG